MRWVEKETRQCLVCAAIVKGRSDKKFCNDYCRNQFNNERKIRLQADPAIRVINHALLRNRTIIRQLLPEGKQRTSTSRAILLAQGFQFRYITHYNLTRSGKTCCFCYDMGYLPLEQERYLLLRANPPIR